MATAPKANKEAPAVTEDDEEWMDGASSEFAKIKHLAPGVRDGFGAGRLLAIWAQSAGERKGEGGKPYAFVETLTLVLDDGPNGDQVTELIGKAPVRLEKFQHSTEGLVARLNPRINGVNAKGIPLRFRPMVGRLNTQPSSRNEDVAAFSISEPTADDMIRARAHKELIMSINSELEKAAAAKEDTAAFD